MITFHHATTILIAGPTHSGKTFFFEQIRENHIIQTAQSHISYVLGQSARDPDRLTPNHHNFDYVHEMKNILDILPIIEADERNLVLLDEQMWEEGKLHETSKPFTAASHTRNITVGFIVQIIFWEVEVG